MKKRFAWLCVVIVVSHGATPAMAANRIAVAFGDSITAGYNGTSYDHASSYVGRVAAATGWTITNHGFSGARIYTPGLIDNVYSQAPTAESTFLTLTGYNDEREYDTDPEGQQIYRGTLRWALAWLAIPAARKILPSDAAVTYSGVWSATSRHGALSATANGASAAIAIAGGSTVYVGTEQVAGQTGVFSLQIDGADYGTFHCFADIRTSFERSYAPVLIRVSNLSDGPHTVVLTKTGGDVVYFGWAASNTGAASSEGPLVFAGNTLPINAAGYAAFGGSDAAVALYNRIHREVVRELAEDGLHVIPVDAAREYRSSDHIAADNLHPNAQGHQHIADAFLAAIGAYCH